MKRLFEAVLKITAKEFSRVYVLAGHVIAQLSANISLFATPVPSVATLTTENNKLDLTIKAKDGSHQKNRACEEQAQVVFNLLKTEIAYVNKIAHGDKATILLSGFDASSEPSPRDVPAQVVIKKIVDEKAPLSAKVFIEVADRDILYKVETTLTPEDANSWKLVLETGNSKKLIVDKGLVHGTEVYFRVAAINTHGQGLWSDVHSFLVR